MRSNTAYLVLFLLAAGITAVLHVIASVEPGYASYWYANAILSSDAGIVQSIVFILLPLVGAAAATAVTRRWDWFPASAAGAVLLPLALRLLDIAAGDVLGRLFGSIT